MRGSGNLKSVRLGVSERFVHFHGEIAGHLDVLLLILADRHDVAVVNQNVRRHEHRIGEQARLWRPVRGRVCLCRR